MQKIRAFMTAVYAASFVAMIVVQGMSSRPDGYLFKSKTGDVSDKYTTLITPAHWTFAIWGPIYLWLVCILGYIIATFWRRQGTGKGVHEEAPATHPFFLSCMSVSFLFLAAWLILFDRENIVSSAALLWIVTFFVFVAGIFNYVTLYEKGHTLHTEKPSEIWLNRIIVQNGIEMYGTWVLFCAFLNTAMAVEYPPVGALAIDEDVAGYLALGMLLFGFLAWFPFEVTLFDKYCRYGVMQYIVAAIAMGGIYSRRDTINNPPLERLALSFMIIAIGMFLVKLFLIGYRAKHKPLFNAPPPPIAMVTPPDMSSSFPTTIR